MSERKIILGFYQPFVINLYPRSFFFQKSCRDIGLSGQTTLYLQWVIVSHPLSERPRAPSANGKHAGSQHETAWPELDFSEQMTSCGLNSLIEKSWGNFNVYPINFTIHQPEQSSSFWQRDRANTSAEAHLLSEQHIISPISPLYI